MFLGIITLLSVVRPALVMGDRGRRIVWGMVGFVCVFWLLMITIPAATLDHYYGSTGCVVLLFLYTFSPLLIVLVPAQTMVLDLHSFRTYGPHRDDDLIRIRLVLARVLHLLCLLWVYCCPVVA